MIHVRTWSGTGSIQITDMTNAGKRGKECQSISFNGWLVSPAPTDAHRAINTLTLDVMKWAGNLDVNLEFEQVAADVENIVRDAKLALGASWNDSYCKIYRSSIRGIDAPRTKLVAGVDEKWTASANEEGIHIRDLVDKNNEPVWITSGQSKAKAYAIAAKVWPQLKSAKTAYEVARILTDAGAQLHSYCAMD